MSAQDLPYQDKLIDTLAVSPRKFVAVDTGLGKSRCVIEAAKRVGARRVLIPCPAIGKVSWPAEIAKWAPDAACHVPPEPALLVESSNAPITFNIVSYDDLARSPAEWLKAAWRYKADVVAPDEAQYLANIDAMRTKVVYGPRCDTKLGLTQDANFVWPLSGTPAPNFTSELWTHLRALAPHTIRTSAGRPMHHAEFQDRYSTTRASTHGMHVTGSVRTPELRARTAEFFYRLRKTDVLKDMPEIIWTHEPIPFAAEAGAILGGLQVPTTLSDDALLKWLEENHEHQSTLRKTLGLAKVAGAVEWARAFLSGCDRKLILFAYHTDVCEALHRALGAEFGSVLIHGGTPLPTRRAAVAQFQSAQGPRVFVGETIACSTALTLTAASDVAFVEGDWTPANLYQAASRADRLTQTRGVIARLLYVPGSLDERIARVAAAKTRAINVMFNEAS
jgi:SWI/SNF-related matrix-associated actin-dependent regulator 1 of chromatin subfamily A